MGNDRKRKPSLKANPIAKSLSSPANRQRVVPDRRRKLLEKIRKKEGS